MHSTLSCTPVQPGGDPVCAGGPARSRRLIWLSGCVRAPAGPQRAAAQRPRRGPLAARPGCGAPVRALRLGSCLNWLPCAPPQDCNAVLYNGNGGVLFQTRTAGASAPCYIQVSGALGGSWAVLDSTNSVIYQQPQIAGTLAAGAELVQVRLRPAPATTVPTGPGRFLGSGGRWAAPGRSWTRPTASITRRQQSSARIWRRCCRHAVSLANRTSMVPVAHGDVPMARFGAPLLPLFL